MRWEKVKLGDITESCLGKMLDKNKNKGEYQPYLANINVRWGSFDLDDLQLMRFEESESERYGIKYGDLIICEGGEPGRCAIWKEQLPNMKIQKALHRVRVLPEKADPFYLFYWFLNAGQRNALDQYYTGATIKHMPGDKLKQVIIDLPDLPTQHRIASILSAYDGLIENNRRQIKLLEEAAQRLYREWFVELRFPGHEGVKVVDGVPEGWRKIPAEDFCQISIGKTPPREEKQWFTGAHQGIKWLSIADMGKNSVFALSTTEALTQEAVDKFNVKKCPTGTVLLSFKLTVGRVLIAMDCVTTNEAIAHFRIDDESYREYLYEYLLNYPYDTLGSTSSISKAINSKIVKALTIVVPRHDLMERFHRIAGPMFEKVLSLGHQNEKLTTARDMLLPKLMSGEMEV